MTTEKNNKTSNARVRMTDDEMGRMRKNASLAILTHDDTHDDADYGKHEEVSVSEYLRVVGAYADDALREIVRLTNLAGLVTSSSAAENGYVTPQDVHDFMKSSEKYASIFRASRELKSDDVNSRAFGWQRGDGMYLATTRLYEVAKAYADAQ